MYNDIHVLINILPTSKNPIDLITNPALSVNFTSGHTQIFQYVQESIIVYNYCRKSKVHYNFYTWRNLNAHEFFFFFTYNVQR